MFRSKISRSIFRVFFPCGPSIFILLPDNIDPIQLSMLKVNPATAYLMTNRLSSMLILSLVFGVVSAILGYLLAIYFDVSIGGSMAAMCGVFWRPQHSPPPSDSDKNITTSVKA